jgi:hypothetical protein
VTKTLAIFIGASVTGDGAHPARGARCLILMCLSAYLRRRISFILRNALSVEPPK